MRVLDTALRETAGDSLRWSVEVAETRTDAVALVLASPEFNRR